MISKEPLTAEEIASKNLPVAIPGKNTTANLLLNFFAPGIQNREEYIFHEVMPAVLEGKAAAGVIIHENRFTYQGLGLQCIQDLGEFWEHKTGLPIPLGAIVAKHTLGSEVLEKLERTMRRSVAFAFAQPEASKNYVRKHAQEMEESVMKAHIQLYVNDFSLALGEKGRAAVEKLLEVASMT